MNTKELIDILNIKEDLECLEFKNVQNKLSTREDLHVFLLLDKLIPSKYPIIECARYDKIILSVELKELAKVITPEQANDLACCGVIVEEERLIMIV